jgi:hypothetical protein
MKGLSGDRLRAGNGAAKNHPNAVKVHGKRVKLPMIGWVRMRGSLRFAATVKSAILSRTADRWFVSLTLESDHSRLAKAKQSMRRSRRKGAGKHQATSSKGQRRARSP